jgi:hypothetical protein
MAKMYRCISEPLIYIYIYIKNIKRRKKKEAGTIEQLLPAGMLISMAHSFEL